MKHGISPRRPPRKPKAEHLSIPYPDLPEAPCKGFWLASYFQNLAEFIALSKIIEDFHKKCSHDEVSSLALHGASLNAQYHLNKAAEHTRASGMILYAWPNSTYFDKPTARH